MLAAYRRLDRATREGLLGCLLFVAIPALIVAVCEVTRLLATV